MQISRHWRLNNQRYRLQGVRLEDGSISLQDRKVSKNEQPVPQPQVNSTPAAESIVARERMAS